MSLIDIAGRHNVRTRTADVLPPKTRYAIDLEVTSIESILTQGIVGPSECISHDVYTYHPSLTQHIVS